MSLNIETYKKWQPFLLGICAALGLWAGLNMRQVDHSSSTVVIDSSLNFDRSQKLKDVLSFVQSKYIDSIDADRATDLTLKIFLSNLDPYSEYIPTHLMHKYAAQIQGKARGIGIKLINIDSQLMVSKVFFESPAKNAGISPGDYILGIDGHTIIPHAHNRDSIYNIIESHESDSIKITWKNRIQDQINENRIPIEELEERPVSGAHSPVKQVLFIKLNQLSKNSYREFMKALEQYFDNKQCKHLIIDLRNNTGGLIHEAAFILNQLVKEKDVLMFKTSGTKTKEKEYRSTGNPFFNIERIVVLINSETASAAELIAAALQDLDRAIIIGSPSIGKSTVLEQFSLGDGSAIRLAVNRFYTNSGRSIQKDFVQSMNFTYLGNSGFNPEATFHSIKKKKLAAHQGVIPEIIIPTNEIENAKRQTYAELADRIIGRNLIEFKTLIENNPDNINQKIKVSQLIQNEILKETQSTNTALQVKLLEEECKYALAKWLFGEGLELRMRLLTDEYLATAIEKLK